MEPASKDNIPALNVQKPLPNIASFILVYLLGVFTVSLITVAKNSHYWSIAISLSQYGFLKAALAFFFGPIINR